jgi:galactose mutarotase-like enzyme
LVAEISERGAELIWLQDRDGMDLLWSVREEWWTWHPPLLFSLVGRLPDDTASFDGEPFPMRQHGFARNKRAIVLAKSTRAMPISFGFHAAFRWLLPHRESRRDHELRFESWESAPIRRLTDGLVDVTASKGNLRKAGLYYVSRRRNFRARLADLRRVQEPP